ncbi:hypothetical protein lerEdw1_003029 [Lerista edwardsae]|nr:hypothetical protein lerEdw1_003029 [Lerista edwardsae]
MVLRSRDPRVIPRCPPADLSKGRGLQNSLSMSNHNSERNNLKPPKKASRSSLLPISGPSKKEGDRLFVGNLPPDIREDEIIHMFKDFGLKTVKKYQKLPTKSFAFLDFVSTDAARLAIQQLNCKVVNGRLITVAFPEKKRSVEPVKNEESKGGMPDLEPVPYEELGLNQAPISKADIQTTQKQKVQYAVPMEMRGSFLVQMLKECFQNMDWLVSVNKVVGKVTLLVMDSLPQTPYFWAIHLTEVCVQAIDWERECHQNMQKLFTALAEVESQAPFLSKRDVQRGTRCLAECIVGDEGKAWNRAWVLDKVEDWAVVFFVDFGFSATVSLNALRKLDGDEFWTIRPLAQPFMLQEALLPAEVMIRCILEGWATGPSQMEPHMVKFVRKAD